MKKEKAAGISSELLNDDEFGNRHRREDRFFSRNRILTFCKVAMLILQKSMKSLQLELNEFSSFSDIKPVTCSAFAQARSHPGRTAFTELNDRAVVNIVYGDGSYKRYRGKFRLTGTDGSEAVLPDGEDIRKESGAVSCTDGKDDRIAGPEPQATASAMYGVLNHTAADSIPGHPGAYEATPAENRLLRTCGNDLILADRNYTSYRFPARMSQSGRDFAGRCAKNTFGAVREMSEGKGKDSRTVSLKPSGMKEVRESGLPGETAVRSVRVGPDTGETEISVTSLTDESLYPAEDFRDLYNMRRGAETFYGLLKTGLNPENFTGKTAEPVKQDFYAAVYLTGLESVLTGGINDEPEEKTGKPHGNREERIPEHNTPEYQQKVNKAVSFNAVKNHVFNLFYPEEDKDVLPEKPENFFRMNKICVRKGRKTGRKKQSPNRTVSCRKRSRKICY